MSESGNGERIILKIGLAILLIVVLIVFSRSEYDFVYRAF